MATEDRYSVVIPVYNEEAVISATYIRLKSVMSRLPGQHELIFVNDGSTDNTEAILRELGARDETVMIINFSRNFGHQMAISAGMEGAAGDAVIVIDADLQDPPELIEDMVEKWRAGYDVVYAKRRARLGETKFKLWTASFFYRILRVLTDVDIPLDTGDFRLIDRKVCDVLTALPEQHRFVRGLVAWTGFRQIAIEYERAPRFAGETKYPLKRMFRLAGDAITSFSDKLLKLPLYVGTFLFIACMLLAMYFAVSSIGFHHAYSGSDWLSVLSLMTCAILLIFVGFVGQYLGRIYDEVRRRPPYIVASRQGFHQESPRLPSARTLTPSRKDAYE